MHIDEDRTRRAVDFLTKEAGMEVEAVARGPALLKFSIERRLAPRLKVLKLFKEKGLPLGDRAFYTVACMSSEKFLNKFVLPHAEILPQFHATSLVLLLLSVLGKRRPELHGEKPGSGWKQGEDPQLPRLEKLEMIDDVMLKDAFCISRDWCGGFSVMVICCCLLQCLMFLLFCIWMLFF